MASVILLAVPIISMRLGASGISQEDHWRPLPPSYQFIDFDKLVKEFIRNKTDNCKTKVSWWDLYARHAYLRRRPEFLKYRVMVEMGELRYGALNTLHENRRWRKEPIRALVNTRNVSTKVIVDGEIKQQTNYTWQVTNGIILHRQKIVLETMITGLGDKTKIIAIDLSNNREVRSDRDGSFAYVFDVPMNPKSSVDLYWNITSWDIEIDFSVDVKIRGHFAVYYQVPHNGHKTWFYPVCAIQQDKLNVSGNSLIYRATGIFRDSRDLSVDLISKTNNPKRRQWKGL